MEIYITSDEHYDHEASIRHSARPFSNAKEMNKAIIESHNKRVKSTDTVYHVGDFAWKNHKEFIDRLNGKHILIVGNHDKMNIDALRAFSAVHDIAQISHKGQKIVLCHFPMESWWGQGGGTWMLHGHTHAMKLIPKKRLYVGVDARRDFAPWSFEELKEVMDELPRF